MFDCHVHSSFSGDSDMDAQEACKVAMERGLEGLAFTDHLDLDYPDFDDIFNIDFDKYSAFMDNLKKEYSGRFKVLKGIEVGIQPQVIGATNKIVSSYDFDFVIASVHVIDNMDPYKGEYYEGKSKQQSFSRYLEEILFSVTNFDNFDVVGHIGYIRRYCSYDDKTLSYADFCDLLDEILKTALSKGKGLEINTSGYRNLGSPMPDYDILTRYKELGGEILTIGSDSHYPEHIAYNFGVARDMLIQKGFKYVTHFAQRKPVFDKL